MAKNGMPRITPDLSTPDPTVEFEYAWRWADKDDDDNRIFNANMTEESIKAYCRSASRVIAPITLVRRPRDAWVEVDFQ